MALSRQTLPLPERVTWETFNHNLKWDQGEHVCVIGATGSGKSTLIRALTWRRDWVSWFGTKKKDETYNDNIFLGYKRILKWPPPRSKQRQEYWMLWPQYKFIRDIYNSAPVFRKALEHIFIDESWTVVLDDLFFLSTKLKLASEISAINYQVRSMGVTLISGMQRPAKVPLETWDQSSHAFISRISNDDDLAKIRGLANVDNRTLRTWVGQLRKHEWLYLPVAKAIEVPSMIVIPPLGRR